MFRHERRDRTEKTMRPIATHPRRIGAWNMDIGRVEEETGFMTLFAIVRQTISVEDDAHHRKTFTFHRNDRFMIDEIERNIINLAREHAAYKTTQSATQALAHHNEIERIVASLGEQGVSVPRWMGNTRWPF